MNLIINDKVIIKDVTVEDIYSTFDGLSEITWLPVILENGEDYIQALSCRKYGILEARFYNGDSFVHYRGRNTMLGKDYSFYNTHTDCPLTIYEKNRLSTQTMKIAFTDFFKNCALSSCVLWDDVTGEFDDEYLIDKV